MSDALKLILSLSLSGSLLAGLIFALKPFIKHRFSKSIQYYLWVVVLLRLLVPFSFEGSMMNQVFYGQPTAAISNSPGVTLSMDGSSQSLGSSSMLPNVQTKVANGEYNADFDHGRYLQDLAYQYLFYLWLIGVVIMLRVNLSGYFQFLKYIRPANQRATDEENQILSSILQIKRKVQLVRNPYVTSPLLIGIFRPTIIIPDLEFNASQLRNILLHETTHLKRHDISIKWLTMLTASLHWFNPLMYFIKKEINSACELSCDEAVIKDFKSAEKQAYGETLLAVVSETQYPNGVLQATMNEEKKALKDRLMAIMQHRRKSKRVVVISGMVLLAVALGGIYLGAGVGFASPPKPPNLYISAEYSPTKEAKFGSYAWKTWRQKVQADAISPLEFQYQPENILSVTAKQQMSVGTQKLKLDKKYDFTLDSMSVYQDGKLIHPDLVEPSFLNGELYLQAPAEAGEYIYTLDLNYGDKGRSTYGFVVRVDMLTYDLRDIAQYKTLYLGNNSKVAAIASRLPLLDKYFRQQFISLHTKSKPYGLTLFYEAADKRKYPGKWPLGQANTTMQANLSKNALVLFCMIDNLDEVTFAFRDSQSDGKLETSKYESRFTFRRKDLAAKYGDLKKLGGNLKLLQATLGN